VAKGVDSKTTLKLQDFDELCGTGAHDCTSAWNDAVAALPKGGGRIHLPCGTYQFNSTIKYYFTSSYPSSLTLDGQGSGCTNLYWPSQENGLEIFYKEIWNQVHIHHLSFLTGAAHTIGAGLSIRNNNSIPAGTSVGSDLNDLIFEDVVQGGPDFWATAIAIYGVSNFTINNIAVNVQNYHGAGLIISGNPITLRTESMTLAGSTINFGLVPPKIVRYMYAYDLTRLSSLNGIKVADTANESVTLEQPVADMIGKGDAILFTQVVAVFNITGFYCAGCQYGVQLYSGAQGVVLNALNCLCEVGLLVAPNSIDLIQLNIINSAFNTTHENIVSDSNIYDLFFSGNFFTSNDTSGTYPAVNIRAATRVHINDNTFDQIASTGASVGLYMDASTANISGNIFQGYFRPVILDSGSAHVSLQSNSYVFNSGSPINSGSGNMMGGSAP